MKAKQSKPGKVLYQILGYRVSLTDKGEYGIYAGKHMFRSYERITAAVQTLDRIIERKPTYHALWTAFDTWLKTK